MHRECSWVNIFIKTTCFFDFSLLLRKQKHCRIACGVAAAAASSHVWANAWARIHMHPLPTRTHTHTCGRAYTHTDRRSKYALVYVSVSSPAAWALRRSIWLGAIVSHNSSAGHHTDKSTTTSLLRHQLTEFYFLVQRSVSWFIFGRHAIFSEPLEWHEIPICRKFKLIKNKNKLLK